VRKKEGRLLSLVVYHLAKEKREPRKKKKVLSVRETGKVVLYDAKW